MANLRGKGSMTQQKLLAVWRDSQVTTEEGNKDGRVTGAYLDVQIDQSDLTSEDIKAGKGQTNPHLNSQANEYKDANGETKRVMNHSTWYSARQLESMGIADMSATQRTADGRNVAAFTADIINRKYQDKDGKSKTRLLVACPKDLDKVKPEDLAKAQAFNEKHKITPTVGFDAEALMGRQDSVLAAVREQRDEQRASTQEMETKAVEAEAEVAEPEDEVYDPFD